jgi:hypothetical protein
LFLWFICNFNTEEGSDEVKDRKIWELRNDRRESQERMWRERRGETVRGDGIIVKAFEVK